MTRLALCVWRRYDCRGHLYDLTRHDADLVKGMPVELTEEERAVETACDEERYLELVTDVQEKAMYEEEEWKRYYESLHEGTYNAVGFSYEYPKASDPQSQAGHEGGDQQQSPEEEEEAFVPPAQLMVPEGMLVPQTEKEHARIERTATFIAKHGAQMEIMVKMKQAKNSQFEFLNFEQPLNLYYQHLLKMIKSGKYRPQHRQQEQQKVEQDQSDQHYLHPSLSTATTTVTTLPPPPPPKPIVMPKYSIEDTAYGQLLSSLKKYHRPKEEDKSSVVPPPLPPFMAQPDYGSSSAPLDALPSSHSQSANAGTATTAAVPVKQPAVKEERVEPPPPGTEVMGPLPRSPSLDDLQGCENMSWPQPAQIVPPPPDMQPIIDRMAMYVAKNGVEFEYVVKSKNDPRFSFLEPGHVHFQYYDFKKNMFLKEAELKKRLEAKQAERERLKQEEDEAAAAAQANRSISFSIKGRNKEPESVNTLKRPLFDYDSSEEEGEGEEGGKEGAEKEDKSRSISPDPGQTTLIPPTTVTPMPTATPLSAEAKPAAAEDLEKKQAEERLKDKLVTAARDKLAACNKEKQLQAERKKKAAMFINLLRIVKESPIPTDKGKEEGEIEVRSSPSVTPGCSKPPSPVPVFEYNNRSGTPTVLNHDLIHKRKSSPSKSPVASRRRSKSPGAPSRKKRRKKSRTPPSAYANPLRSPPRFNPSQRRSHSPRRGIVGSRRMSPIRPFRSRRSPSPPVREWSPLQRNRSPLRKKVSGKRSRSQSPSQGKHKKKHKRSRSKTPKKKKKDRTRSGSKERDASKSGRSHDKAADKHKGRDKKKDKEKKKERDKKDKERKDRDKKDKDRKEKERKDKKDRDRHKSRDTDKHGGSKPERSREKGKDSGSEPKLSSSTPALPEPKPSRASPPPTTADPESKTLSPVPEIIFSSSSDSSSSSEDEGQEKVEGGEAGHQPLDKGSTDLPHANGHKTGDNSGSQDSVTHIDLS